MNTESIWLWVGFNAFVLIMLVLDLFVFHKQGHVIKVKEALLWTAFWMALAGVFGLGVYYFMGVSYAAEFATGYLIEQALSIDNLFVILMLFTFFRTPTAFQHKVLFWGILGAIFFRIVFILGGVALIQRFNWMTYLLGVFLIYTAIKMIFDKDEGEVDPDKNFAMRLVSKVMPVTKLYQGDNFFVKIDGRRAATPLFIVLLVIETTDIVFALDSIPAILAISSHPFIIYSSNIFAVLGLRSLYFALAGIMQLFKYLKYGLAAILFFVGVKIILENRDVHIDTFLSLGVVFFILISSILLSIIKKDKGSNPLTHHKGGSDVNPFPTKK